MFNKEHECQALTIFFFSPNESQPIMVNMNCVGACARKHIPYKPSTTKRGCQAIIYILTKNKKTKQNSFKDALCYQLRQKSNKFCANIDMVLSTLLQLSKVCIFIFCSKAKWWTACEVNSQNITAHTHFPIFNYWLIDTRKMCVCVCTRVVMISKKIQDSIPARQN